MGNSSAMNYRVVQDEDGFGRCLVPLAGWSGNLLNILKSEGARSLRLSGYVGWNGGDLAPLDQLRDGDLDALEVYSLKVTDLSSIARFSSLRKIGLETRTMKGVALSRFQKIEYFCCSRPPISTFEVMPPCLKSLKILNFQESTLQGLAPSTTLRKLWMYGKKISSISGISKFPKLASLVIGDAVRLVDISDIRNLPALQSISLHRALELNRLEDLASCGNLNNLELDNCGQISSLKFTGALNNLETIRLLERTDVQDGDLLPLTRLPKLRSLVMVPRRHYAPTVKEVRAQLKI